MVTTHKRERERASRGIAHREIRLVFDAAQPRRANGADRGTGGKLTAAST